MKRKVQLIVIVVLLALLSACTLQDCTVSVYNDPYYGTGSIACYH